MIDQQWQERRKVFGFEQEHRRSVSARHSFDLIEQGGEQCSLCGWHELHPRSGKIPLDTDHINGNYAQDSTDEFVES